jgi:hypothetical protein
MEYILYSKGNKKKKSSRDSRGNKKKKSSRYDIRKKGV